MWRRCIAEVGLFKKVTRWTLATEMIRCSRDGLICVLDACFVLMFPAFPLADAPKSAGESSIQIHIQVQPLGGNTYIGSFDRILILCAIWLDTRQRSVGWSCWGKRSIIMPAKNSSEFTSRRMTPPMRISFDGCWLAVDIRMRLWCLCHQDPIDEIDIRQRVVVLDKTINIPWEAWSLFLGRIKLNYLRSQAERVLSSSPFVVRCGIITGFQADHDLSQEIVLSRY